mgnify:CR=1 FL=1
MMSRNEGNKLFKAGVFLGAILCVMLVAALSLIHI